MKDLINSYAADGNIVALRQLRNQNAESMARIAMMPSDNADMRKQVMAYYLENVDHIDREIEKLGPRQVK
jgi:CobQ-like glutamine amidotransferase family enzyme